MAKIDLSGQHFGKLFVIGLSGKNHRGEYIWKCLCECNKETFVKTYNLRSGHTISCGCQKKGPDRDDSIIGKRFGNLTVLSFHSMDNENGRLSKYNLLCDCGKIVVGYKNKLKTRKRCRKCSYIAKEKICGNVPNWYFNIIKASAKHKKREFNITIEYINDIFNKQNGICIYTGRKLYFSKYSESCMRTASLDRIDSNKGYIKGNVQWVHKDINYIKSDYSQEEFIKLCFEVSNYVKSSSVSGSG